MFAPWIFVAIAVLLLAVSFIGSGTASDNEQLRWARRFGISGIVSAVIAVILFLL